MPFVTIGNGVFEVAPPCGRQNILVCAFDVPLLAIRHGISEAVATGSDAHLVSEGPDQHMMPHVGENSSAALTAGRSDRGRIGEARGDGP